METERSEGGPKPRACESCDYFHPVDERVVQLGSVPRGECRRFPPQVIGFPVGASMGQVAIKTAFHFPVMPNNFWCGEFLSKEPRPPALPTPPARKRTMWD